MKTWQYGACVTRADVLGCDVFVWDNLSVPQLTALRRAVLPTVLEGRG